MFYKNQLNVYQLCILISQRASAMYVKQRTLIVKPYSGPLVYYFDPHAPILVSAYVSHISYNIDRMSVFAGLLWWSVLQWLLRCPGRKQVTCCYSENTFWRQFQLVHFSLHVVSLLLILCYGRQHWSVFTREILVSLDYLWWVQINVV